MAQEGRKIWDGSGKTQDVPLVCRDVGRHTGELARRLP